MFAAARSAQSQHGVITAVSTRAPSRWVGATLDQEARAVNMAAHDGVIQRRAFALIIIPMQAWQIVDYVLTDFHTTVARGEAAHLLWSMQHAADPARRGAAGRSAMAPSVGRTPPGGRRGSRRA
jgi:hypothetical protein